MDQDNDKEILDVFDDTGISEEETLSQEADFDSTQSTRGFKSKGHTLVIWILGVIIIVILLAMFFRGGQKPVTKNLNALRNKVDQMDLRVARVEAVGKNFLSLEKQVKTVNKSISKLEASNRSLTQSVEKLTRDLEKLKTKKATATPKASVVSSLKPESQYHIVKRGDTLYRISRIYGVSVKKLREINNLKANQNIYPGQKLLLKP